MLYSKSKGEGEGEEEADARRAKENFEKQEAEEWKVWFRDSVKRQKKRKKKSEGRKRIRRRGRNIVHEKETEMRVERRATNKKRKAFNYWNFSLKSFFLLFFSFYSCKTKEERESFPVVFSSTKKNS